jgi:hypothetical protein
MRMGRYCSCAGLEKASLGPEALFQDIPLLDPIAAFLVMLVFWTGIIPLVCIKSDRERRAQAGRAAATPAWPAPPGGS